MDVLHTRLEMNIYIHFVALSMRFLKDFPRPSFLESDYSNVADHFMLFMNVYSLAQYELAI